MTETVNETLLTQYFTQGDLPNLLACFRHCQKRMERSEALSRAYLKHIEVLEARLSGGLAQEPSVATQARGLRKHRLSLSQQVPVNVRDIEI